MKLDFKLKERDSESFFPTEKDEEVELPVGEIISHAIERAVTREINKIMPPKMKADEIHEPDWSSEDAIQGFIRLLEGDINDVEKVQHVAAERTMSTEEVKREVERLLSDAVRTINAKRQELNNKVVELEARRVKQASRITNARKALAELASTKNQLERLAELEQQLKTICEGFGAWEQARPYQVDSILLAVQAFMNDKRGFLDADDMGMGKTFKSTVVMFVLTALYIKKYSRRPKILWVTKKSLIKSNMREILRWWPDHKIIPNLGTDPQSREMFYDFAMKTDAMLICSYENVRDTEIIRETKWDLVFADEVHRLKGGANKKKPTLIWQVMRDVCANAHFIYFLSGTPIVNKGEEMWAYLHIFDPAKFPTVDNFMYAYMDPMFDEGGNPIFKVNVQRLMNALVGQMIHRTKQEVGMQLPDKERVFYYLDMDTEQRKIYDMMRDNLFVTLEKGDEKAMISASVIIAQINRLRQIALYPRSLRTQLMDGTEITLNCDESVKLDQAVELVEQIGDQVVIFSSQYNPPIFELVNRFQTRGLRVEAITGAQRRDTSDIEQEFQQGKIDVLIINMMTGSEGLNLHKSPEYWPGGASHAIFLDLWWNPAKNVQAEDRIWRDGVVEPVTIHILQCEDSADAFVASKVQEKQEMIAGIMERGELRPPSEWRELLEGLV